MAEGEHLSRTLKGGSDALIDSVCTQCHKRGSKQQAIDFCQDCKQYLCTVCRRYHIQYRETHTLVSVASSKQPQIILPTVSPVPVVAKCRYHPDLDLEMYCGTHDMVYCCRCIAMKHRLCSDVEVINDVAHQYDLSTLQSLVAEITRVSTQLHTTKSRKLNDLQLLQKKRASLLEEIEALRKTFNKHLDELEQNILTELDEEQTKLEKEIGDDISVVDDLIIASNNIIPDLTPHDDEKKTFIAEKVGQVVLAEANEVLEKADVLKQSTLKFEPNDILCEVFKKSDRIGKITRSDTKPKHTQGSRYIMKSINDINVRVDSDNNSCCINGMCQLPDGSFLLIDNYNNKLKRLDDQLNMKYFLDLEAEPMGLSYVSPTEVAVRLKDKTIHFISVGTLQSHQRIISINELILANDGMVCGNNQLWIPGAGAVYVYSLSGSLMKKIETDSQGRTIFPKHNPCHTAVSDDETKFCVAAWRDRVVVFNNSGDVMKEMHDQRLNVACGICTTEDDIVLVAGYWSKNVVMFDRDGKRLGELLSRKDMLSNPQALCYDRKRCRLLVGYSSDTVQIFQLN